MVIPENALALQEVPVAVPAPRLSNDQRALAAAWAADLAARVDAGLLSARTAAAYKDTADAWLEWLDRAAVAMPTPAHVLAYVAHLRQGHAPATVNSHLAAVRCLYAWAETQNAYPAIGRSVRCLPVRKDEPLDALDPAQVSELLAHADAESLAGLRDRALVHVLFSTACRLVSICAADAGDLDHLDAVLTYAGKGSRGQKDRRAYLSASAMEAVRRYLSARRRAEGKDLAPDAPLFAAVGNRAGGRRLSARSVRRQVVAMMERAGHVRRGEDGRLVRPRVLSAHSLRRSAITAAYDAAGMDAAQTLAGHADPKTTMRHYARVKKGRTLRDLATVLDLDHVRNERTADA